MVTIPTVHMNGDTREELIRVNMRVYEKAGDLLTALYQSGPNGRNFYPQGVEAIIHAAEEHRDRIEAVQRIKAEMEEIVHALQQGGDGRGR